MFWCTWGNGGQWRRAEGQQERRFSGEMLGFSTRRSLTGLHLIFWPEESPLDRSSIFLSQRCKTSAWVCSLLWCSVASLSPAVSHCHAAGAWDWIVSVNASSRLIVMAPVWSHCSCLRMRGMTEGFQHSFLSSRGQSKNIPIRALLCCEEGSSCPKWLCKCEIRDNEACNQQTGYETWQLNVPLCFGNRWVGSPLLPCVMMQSQALALAFVHVKLQ